MRGVKQIKRKLVYDLIAMLLYLFVLTMRDVTCCVVTEIAANNAPDDIIYVERRQA